MGPVPNEAEREQNMNYKISVVDDNQSDVEYIMSLVKRWAVENGHALSLSHFPSAEAFLFHHEGGQGFDVLLLDIEMGEMNGVELAKKVRQADETVQVVFITGFPDFIAEGYEVSALHYLMKPVSEEKLHSVLDKAVANLAKAEKRLRVIHDRQTDLVPLSRILYVEAQKQYVLVHTANEVYRMKATLAETEKALDEYFFKCQRSFLINLRHVARIKTDSVVLKNGEEVPISRGMSGEIGKKMIRLF